MKKIKLFNLKKEFFKFEFIKEKITLNKAIIIVFGLFCLYIIYLSIPSFYNEELVKNRIKQEINKIYESDSVYFEKLTYSIFPKPHYKIESVVIFKKNKYEFAKIKKINLLVSQRNFLKKNNLNIKIIQFINGNFYFNYSSFVNFKNYIKSNNIKAVQIRKSNFFIIDKNFSTIAISIIKNFNLKYNKNKNSNELIYKGQIYNLPFKLKYNIDLYKREAELELNFKKINLSFKNISKDYQSEKFINEIQFLRTKFNSLINFNKSKKIYSIHSNNSVIQQNAIDYFGEVSFEPFYFNFQFNIDSINQDKLFFINNFFKQLISNYFLNNKNLNGDIEINIKKIKKHSLFKDSNIKININRGKFNLSNTLFSLGDIGKLKILSSEIQNNNEVDEIILSFYVEINIDDQKKLFKKFLIPKKNRKKLDNIFVNIKLIPGSKEILFSNFYLGKNKDELFAGEEFSIISWQEFRNLVNDLYYSYSG
tara:strand:+ start:420 stop:1856 length:1437 start_codon:yes stop_codon:yes gene_type:complete